MGYETRDDSTEALHAVAPTKGLTVATIAAGVISSATGAVSQRVSVAYSSGLAPALARP
jgi:hypothetical protein